MLIELLIIEGRNREANKYIRHFMGVLRKQMTEEQRRVEQIPGYDKVYAYTVNEFREWKLVNMVQQYKMTESERKREEIWSECLWTYKELARENGLADDSLLYEGGERLAEFYYLYMLQLLEEINSSKKSINMQMDMYLYMLKVCKKEEWEEKLATLFEKLTDRYKERVKEDVYLKSKLAYVFLKSMWQLNVGTKDEQKFWAKECDFCLLTLRQCVGKDNEEKLVLWDKAVGENTRYDKYDESEICYKNQFALLDPVFGLLDMEESAEYWRPSDESEPYKSDVKKNTIFFYWEKVKQRIQNVLLLDDWDKMVELVEHFYERLIHYYSYELFSREDAESWQETFTKWKEYETGSKGESFLYETHNQEFARHVADLVTFPGWINRYRPAAFLALVAVYISLTEEHDKEFLRAVYPERDGSVNLLVEKVSKKLKQTADPKFIPVVCERIEKILTWFPDDEDLQPLKQSMESFLARYQEMEFKE